MDEKSVVGTWYEAKLFRWRVHSVNELNSARCLIEKIYLRSSLLDNRAGRSRVDRF